MICDDSRIFYFQLTAHFYWLFMFLLQQSLKFSFSLSKFGYDFLISKPESLRNQNFNYGPIFGYIWTFRRNKEAEVKEHWIGFIFKLFVRRMCKIKMIELLECWSISWCCLRKLNYLFLFNISQTFCSE